MFARLYIHSIHRDVLYKHGAIYDKLAKEAAREELKRKANVLTKTTKVRPEGKKGAGKGRNKSQKKAKKAPAADSSEE